MLQSETQLNRALDIAISKSRELAIKLAEREKHVHQQQAAIQIGEKEYEEEKQKLEAAVIELNTKREILKKKILERKKDLAEVSSKVEKLEDADSSFAINRGVSFVPVGKKSTTK